MATNLFNAALDDPALMAKVAAAVEQTAGSIDSLAEAQAAVARAASDSELRSELQEKLQAVAAENGIDSLSDAVTAVSEATELAFALEAGVPVNAHSSNPTSLGFATAAAIFAPSLFG